MGSKNLADALDENVFANKYFKKIYVVYAYWAILAPILTMFFYAVNFEIDFFIQHFIIAFLFVLTKIVEKVSNIKNIKFKKLKTINILFIALLIWFVMVTFITQSINTGFLIGLMFFVMFILFSSVDAKCFSMFAFIFVLEMILESCLGLLDLHNKWVPGFRGREYTCYAMSMHFLNPNWAAVAVIIAEIICLWFMYDTKRKLYKSLFLIGYMVMAVGLFVGGSYAPEFAMLIFELLLIILLWVRYKKCPWIIVTVFLSTILISFIVWLFPLVREVSTAEANFFYESLAVFDNIFNTELLTKVSNFFNSLFGWNKISIVAGADGWERSDLTRQALAAIFSSPKSFLVGYGCGYVREICVHNCYLAIWMEFGIVGLLLFLAICAMIVLRFIKVKKNDFLIFMFITLAMALFESIFCCLEPYNFSFIVIFAAVIYKMLNCAGVKDSKAVRGNIENKKEKNIEKAEKINIDLDSGIT